MKGLYYSAVGWTSHAITHFKNTDLQKPLGKEYILDVQFLTSYSQLSNQAIFKINVSCLISTCKFLQQVILTEPYKILKTNIET